MVIETLIAYVIGRFYFQEEEKAIAEREEYVHVINYLFAAIFIGIITLSFNYSLSIEHLISWLLTFTMGVLLFEKWGREAVTSLLTKGFHPLLFKHKEVSKAVFFISLSIVQLTILLLAERIIEYISGINLWLLSLVLLFILISYIFRQEKNMETKIFIAYLKQILLYALVTILAFIILFILEDSSGLTIIIERNQTNTLYVNVRNYGLILLLLGKPVNLLIRLLSTRFDPKEELTESGIKGAGAMIGNLERMLIFIALLFGETITVVAILSIKAFARYKKIVEDPAFAEYFVIGTMLSILATLAAYLLFQFL